MALLMVFLLEFVMCNVEWVFRLDRREFIHLFAPQPYILAPYGGLRRIASRCFSCQHVRVESLMLCIIIAICYKDRLLSTSTLLTGSPFSTTGPKPFSCVRLKDGYSTRIKSVRHRAGLTSQKISFVQTLLTENRAQAISRCIPSCALQSWQMI